MPAAFITGGAIRVGCAIVMRLAQEGYDIALHYHGSSDSAEQTAVQVRALGRQCVLLPADLTQPGVAHAVVEKALAALPISLVVHNAAIFERVDFLHTTEDVFDRHMALNLKAPFFLSQVFTQQWQKHNTPGHIVSILDTAVTAHFDKYCAYLLAKKSLLDFTLMAARALGPSIRVNAVSPGAMLPDPSRTQAQIDDAARAYPLGHTPTVEEVADAVLMLERSPYLTGQNIFVDSGKNLL